MPTRAALRRLAAWRACQQEGAAPETDEEQRRGLEAAPEQASCDVRDVFMRLEARQQHEQQTEQGADPIKDPLARGLEALRQRLVGQDVHQDASRDRVDPAVQIVPRAWHRAHGPVPERARDAQQRRPDQRRHEASARVRQGHQRDDRDLVGTDRPRELEPMAIDRHDDAIAEAMHEQAGEAQLQAQALRVDVAERHSHQTFQCRNERHADRRPPLAPPDPRTRWRGARATAPRPGPPPPPRMCG